MSGKLPDELMQTVHIYKATPTDEPVPGVFIMFQLKGKVTMAKDTKIEWTATHLPDGTILPGHTLNFWWGCVKVSPGCEHCYAEAFSKRVGRNIWGPAKTTERWRTKSPWRDVIKWNAKAQAEGVRRKVLCQSMSDFFEDHPQVAPWRSEACEILESLTWLDIQLLTKRAENIERMVPTRWLDNWPAHVWIGTSVEDQQRADERIPHLLSIPARVRFLSCEPLLGSVDIGHAIPCGYYCDPVGPDGYGHHNHPFWTPQIASPIDWVIVGGESGHNARHMDEDWVRSLRDQCVSAGVAFFYKQSVIDGKKVGLPFLDGKQWNESPQ